MSAVPGSTVCARPPACWVGRRHPECKLSSVGLTLSLGQNTSHCLLGGGSSTAPQVEAFYDSGFIYFSPNISHCWGGGGSTAPRVEAFFRRAYPFFRPNTSHYLLGGG